jgi:hypothetical protein
LVSPAGLFREYFILNIVIGITRTGAEAYCSSHTVRNKSNEDRRNSQPMLRL